MNECYNRQWISAKDGNISFKPANKGYYYITPGGIRKNNLKETDILQLDLYSNRILENYSNRKPSGEIILHNLLLKDNIYHNQNLCVIHCHPPYILAFVGLLKTNNELNLIRKVFPEIDANIKIGKNVEYIEARTKKLGQTVYNNLLNNSIVALKRHGVVSIGETFEEAIENIETIEYYCRIYSLEKNESII